MGRKREVCATLGSRCASARKREICEKRLRRSKSEKSGIDSAPCSQKLSGCEKRHSKIKDQPLARGRAHLRSIMHGGAHHSVAIHGQDNLSNRAVRDDANAPGRGDQCGIYLFCCGDFSDVDIRAFCLRLGLSHSRPSGFLRVDAKENWPHPEAVSVEATGLCPARRRFVHVRLANGSWILFNLSTWAHYSEVNEPSCPH